MTTDSLTPETQQAAIPAQRRAERYAPAPLDLHDRAVLVRSWLHTLHGQSLDPRPRTVGPLPGWRELVPTALAWHVAYAVVALAGALVIQRSGSGSVVADELARAGRPGLAVATVVLWWGGVATASVLWWAAVVSVRTR